MAKRSKFRWTSVALVICALTGIGALICFVKNSPEFNQYELLSSYKSKRPTETAKIILLWTEFFGDKYWSLPNTTLGPSYFEDQGCAVTNCVITSNKRFLSSDSDYDAILFHVGEPFSIIRPIPATRSSKQKYVFALMESPAHTKHFLKDENNFYNLTMTYRLDSDILWPYNNFIDRETKAFIAPNLNPKWKTPPVTYYTQELQMAVANKSKLAAWFVSHCETLSKREDLVKSLQKFIDIDIFGKCGSFKCPRNSKMCDKLLDDNYKFYFALENSLCTDYVTEKFYNALNRQLIPVVFGGADYTRLAPPFSYINAENFKTTKQLAKYLVFLDENPLEYIKYFWWREHYQLAFKSPYCDLCQKLNEPNANERLQVYKNIEEWWLGNSCYFKSKIQIL